jgi:hypothetical protein
VCTIGWRGVACIVRGKKDSERDKNRKVGERNKNEKSAKKRGWKKNKFWKFCCSRESTHEPNQEGSEGHPLSHKYLRKGPT